MFRIGVTGGIGSGKSTVCKIMEDYHIPVFYSDKVAKDLVHNDPEVRKKIIDIFGEDIYPEGKFDTQALGAIVFKNKKKLAKLNNIIHPLVQERFEAWEKKLDAEGCRYIAMESALLIETKGHKKMDYVVVVTASEQERIKRTRERDGTTEEQVRAKINNQIKEADRLTEADFIITNEIGSGHEDFNLTGQVLKMFIDIKDNY